MGNEALGNALGWVSIACWIIVYSPQVIENYQLKSGEGLSVLFVVIWLLGDLCNLMGALMAGLQTTVIIIAIYYSLCDITLLSQIFYYRRTHPVRLARTTQTPGVIVSNEAGEEASLLGARAPETVRETKRGRRYGRAALLYTAAVVFIIATGLAAWIVDRNESDGADAEPRGPKDVIEWKSQVVGWSSAVLYLGSRIPQILKNFKTKCEGLSLALFLFTIVGNVTYVLSICVASMERQHLVANASWLAGSGLTVFLDVFVLCQFFYFRAAERVLVSETVSCANSEQ
ncbi:hypothetical protein M0805_001471 [Coniferiporia weirii]|nr:hypothetical protein M0805_001471 [Coniferiporia weirii]